jgi:hypothetical protein
MRTIRSKLTYANVISTLCLFLLLGSGAAFAATQLGKNSVGTKQIKNSAVTGAKIKKHAITGTNINLAKLGTVPSATTANTATTAGTANTAQTANSLGAPEGWREVGTSGQPEFVSGWQNLPSTTHTETAGFYKDHEGIVHLKGAVNSGPSFSVIFRLPPGFRPTSGDIIRTPAACSGGTGCPNGVASVTIVAGNFPIPADEGDVISPTETTEVYLNGISFRAGS